VDVPRWDEADEILGFLTREDGIDRLARNVGKKLTTTCCVIAQKSAVLGIK
jgi:hypothetical protein